MHGTSLAGSVTVATACAVLNAPSVELPTVIAERANKHGYV